MKLFATSIKLILLLSCLLSACKGQKKADADLQQTNRSNGVDAVTTTLDDHIWEIFEDSKGQYWFGSNDHGVYRYDGVALQQYTMVDGLADNTVRNIKEDSEGRIFIETPVGVSRYDGSHFVTLPIVRSDTSQWRLNGSDLWFNCNATARHVYRCDGDRLIELQLPQQEIRRMLDIDPLGQSYSPYTVYGVDKDKAGNLWFGTILAGAFRYDGTSFLWVGETELSRLPDGREPGVRSILEDENGYMWLSNFKSKYNVINGDSITYEKVSAAQIPVSAEDDILYFNSGLTDRNGDLWMTTYGGGVWHYDGETLSHRQVRNETEELLLICIYEDSKGTLWLGTNNDGVYRYDGAEFIKFEPEIN